MVNSVTSVNFLELPNPPKDEESRWVFFINRRGLLDCADHSTKNFTTRGVQVCYECKTRLSLHQSGYLRRQLARVFSYRPGLPSGLVGYREDTVIAISKLRRPGKTTDDRRVLVGIPSAFPWLNPT